MLAKPSLISESFSFAEIQSSRCSLPRMLFGDPSKPGIYGVVIKWYPGNFSQPHFHDQERYAYVISGTWWVSTSNVYDEKTTYPVQAGTVAIDTANTVHWDGARLGEKEPAVLVLVGMS